MNTIKKHIMKGGRLGDYTSQSYVDQYSAEVHDPLHRPSSHRDNFTNKLEIYKSIDSTPFYNDYYFDFLDKYPKDIRNVKYLEDSELNFYKTYVKDKKILSRHITDIIKKSPKGAAKINFIFIMNIFGEIYVIEKSKTKEYQINHTSLSKGKEVSSAGWLSFNTENEIVEIANMTGHYQSSNISMYNIIKRLLALGVSISKAKLKIQYFENGNKIDEEIFDNALTWYNDNIAKYANQKISEEQKINYLLSDKIYNSKLIGDFLKCKDKFTYYLILKDNNELSFFNKRDMINNIEKFFSLSPNKTNKDNRKMFFDLDNINKFGIFTLNGMIHKKEIKIKITSYENLKNNNLITIDKFSDNTFNSNYLGSGNNVNVLLFNRKIKKSQIYSDQFLIKDKETYILGRISNDLKNVKSIYSLGNYWEKFNDLFLLDIFKNAVFDKNKCNFDVESLRNFANIENTVDKFKKNYCIKESEFYFYKNFILSDIIIKSRRNSNINIKNKLRSIFFVPDINESININFTNLKPVELIYVINEYANNLLTLFSSSVYSLKDTFETYEGPEFTLDELIIDGNNYNSISIDSSSYSLINNQYIKVPSILSCDLSNIYYNVIENRIYILNKFFENKYTHPCIAISKLIADILILALGSINKISDNNFSIERNIENELLLEIIILGLLKGILASIKFKEAKIINNWKDLLRTGISIELNKNKTSNESINEKINVLIHLVMNNIGKLNRENSYIFKFTDLINELDYYLNTNDKKIDSNILVFKNYFEENDIDNIYYHKNNYYMYYRKYKQKYLNLKSKIKLNQDL